MANRCVTFFKVNNGNCCLVNIDDFCIVFDLHGTEELSSWELLKPHLLPKNGKYYLDVLCISHGDQDHCGGFVEWKNKIDAGELVIGSIWHPNYDRTKVQDVADLPEDYLSLHAEIIRRRELKSQTVGNIEVPLTAWDDESIAFRGLVPPNDIVLRVLSPYIKDEGDTDWDVNNISLVINISISNLSILFPGDSGSEIWQDRIIPLTLSQTDKKDWAKANLLVASHHGSYSFFGKSREEVRDAEGEPENYKALDYISPERLIVSAVSRFPISGDQSGDQPPHYAAWKWYHKWFRENRAVKEDDKHPALFTYTSDGHVRIEDNGGGWQWRGDWSPDDEGGDGGKGATITGFKYRGGQTRRDRGEYA